MSEEIPSSRPRPVRILALHAGPSSSSSSSSWTPSQSAASYRAQLAPLINALPAHWEVHFIEAGFAVDPAARSAAIQGAKRPTADRTRGERIRRALLDCSLLDAWSAQIESETTRRAMLDDRTSSSSSSASSSSSPSEAVSRVQSLRKSLVESEDEARTSTYKVYLRSGLDEAEALLMAEGQLAPDRDWFIELDGDDHGGQPQPRSVGLQASLARVGDYLRERGPFHIGIGSGSGYEVLRLASNLLAVAAAPPQSPTPSSSGASRVTSATEAVLAYPLLFPLLPLNAPAPRMGGWEVLPSLPLPNGRRRALCQGGLHALVRLGRTQPALGKTFWCQEARKWAGSQGQTTMEETMFTAPKEAWKLALVPLPPSVATSQPTPSRTEAVEKEEGEEEEDDDDDLIVSPTPLSSSSTRTTQASLQANSSTLLTPEVASYLSRQLRKLCGHLEIVPGLEPRETRRLLRLKEEQEQEEQERRDRDRDGSTHQDEVHVSRDRITPRLGQLASARRAADGDGGGGGFGGGDSHGTDGRRMDDAASVSKTHESRRAQGKL